MGLYDFLRSRSRISDLAKIAKMVVSFKEKYGAEHASLMLEAIGIYSLEAVFRYVEANKEKRQ